MVALPDDGRYGVLVLIFLIGPALTFSIELADETVTVLSFYTR